MVRNAVMVNKNNGPGKNMYNNEVTYHDKWDTPKNRWYRNQAMKIANRSDCLSDIPLSWARESYLFLKHIDEKYGIRYSTETYLGYYYPRPLQFLKLLFVEPITTFPRTFKRLLKDVFVKSKKKSKFHSKTRLDGVKETLWGCDGYNGYLYGYALLWHRVCGYLYNKINKPMVHLYQYKEKFGTLRVYYSAPPLVANEIENYIKKVEFSLSIKGAYCDLTEGNNGQASNSNP